LVHAVRGFDDEGAVLLRQSTELSREHGYAAEAAAAYRELGYVDALAGRRASAARYLDAAVAFAEGPDMLAGIQAVAGFNLVDWGRTGEGLDQYRAAIENARAAANRRREIWALGIGARGLVANGELDEAEDWLTGCLHMVREEHWAAFHPWPAALLVEARIQKGWTTPELRQGLEEAFVLSCQLADPCWEAAAARTLSLWHAKVGEMGPAHDWLAEARTRCARTTDAYVALQVEIVADQARLSRSVGEIAAADRFGREWVSLAARTQMDAEILKAAAFINGA
jgi:tetratricopeptide (TPR) repeat protein